MAGVAPRTGPSQPQGRPLRRWRMDARRRQLAGGAIPADRRCGSAMHARRGAAEGPPCVTFCEF